MKKTWIATAVVAVLLWTAAPASADDVDEELRGMAKQVADLVKDQHEIKIGRFIGPVDFPSNFGPEIQRVLADEFGKLKVTVDPKAKIEISGNYRRAEGQDGKSIYLRINAQLIDTKSGEPLDKLRIDSPRVFDNDALARVFGTTTPIPLPKNNKDDPYLLANGAIKKALDKPGFYANGSRISSKEGSPIAIEVLVVDEKDAPDPRAGAPVQPTKEGLPYVQIKREQFYRLRIHNNAKFDVAVKIGIDGLDQFVFCDKAFRKEDGEPKFSFRIIPKGKSETVSGWFRNKKEFDYFVVTEYGKSASAELNRDPGEAGQIVLRFYACWEKAADKPGDEPVPPPTVGLPPPDGTGRRPGGREDTTEVKANTGTLRDTIGIRYGSTRP